jgi:hypothetical protein
MGSSRGSYGCRESGPLLMTGHSIGGPYHPTRFPDQYERFEAALGKSLEAPILAKVA